MDTIGQNYTLKTVFPVTPINNITSKVFSDPLPIPKNPFK